MNIAFYNGVSGMIAFQQGMDVLAHNMANVNTAGFKPTKAAFVDLLYTQMDINQNDQLTGHGVKVQANDLMYAQGNLNTTGNALDFALVGDGFFAVDRGGEQLEYTRNGALNISVQGEKGYLVTTDGGYVLDSKGKPIVLDKLENSNLYNLEGLSEKLGIFTFPNPYGLSPRNGSSFVQSEISGAPKAANVAQGQEAPYKLVQYALESSKVELSQEMTQVILTQRAFQMNARIVQTADQIEEIVNNLR